VGVATPHTRQDKKEKKEREEQCLVFVIVGWTLCAFLLVMIGFDS
jgi:hypothetical protein